MELSRYAVPNLDDIPSYASLASDMSQLAYDPAHVEVDGTIEIGWVMSNSGDYVGHYLVDPRFGDGRCVILLATYDVSWDRGEPAVTADGQAVEMWRCGKEDSDEAVPFDDAAEAFGFFRTIVYSSPEVDRYENAIGTLKEVLRGYPGDDPDKMPFGAFKEAVEAACHIDRDGGAYSSTPLANALIGMRYPFLLHFDGDDVRLESTHLDSVPEGWRIAFGLELFEDIRNQAFDEDPMVWRYRLCQMSIQQIKEKFGGLRVYMTGWARVRDIIDAYETVSTTTCIRCGKANATRITGGWISPYCWNHVPGQENIRKFGRAFAEEHCPEDGAWDERYAITRFGEFLHTIETTRSSFKAETLEEMKGKWECLRFRKGDEPEIENRAIGLLDGTPAPNGEPMHIVQVIDKTIRQMRELEQAPSNDARISEFARKHPEFSVTWFSNEEKPGFPF